MSNRISARWLQNPMLVALLLLAFCSRALIPVGYMPGPGGLMLCSGYAPVAAATSSPDGSATDMQAMDMSTMDMAAMDMSGMRGAPGAAEPSSQGGSGDHQGSTACPFAACATAMASAPTTASAVVLHIVVPRIFLPPQPVVPRGTVVPTRLPRGPPAFA